MWDVDGGWAPPEMERPLIGQGEDSLEATEQEARERRTSAMPVNPRGAPADPFPADRGSSAPPRVTIPARCAKPAAAAAAAAVAAPVAAAPATAALPLAALPQAGVTGAAPLGTIALQPNGAALSAATPHVQAALSMPFTQLGGSGAPPQQIILQPGQTLFPPGGGGGSGGSGGQPIILLSHDMRPLPYQLGANNTIQLPPGAHLQPQIATGGGHGQVIMHLPPGGFPDMAASQGHGPRPEQLVHYQDMQQPLPPQQQHQQHQQQPPPQQQQLRQERSGDGGGGYADRHEPYGRRERDSPWERGQYGPGREGGDVDWDHDGGGGAGRSGDGYSRGHPGGGGEGGGRGGRGRRGRVPCMYFNTAKGCKKGDSCAFEHVRGERRLDGGRGRGDRGRGRRGGGRGGRGGSMPD